MLSTQFYMGHEVKSINSHIEDNSREIQYVKERLAEIEAWKEKVATFPPAADSSTEQDTEDEAHTDNAMPFATKDIIIAVLAVANAVLIILFLYRECGAPRAHYSKVYASESEN